MAPKVDLKREIDGYRATAGVFRVVTLPPLPYLMIDGSGDPNTAPAFTGAVESLYPLAYALKFASKKQLDRDYVVMPLEGLWWADEMDAFTAQRDKSRWEWTLLMMIPEWIDDDLFGAAVARVASASDPVRLHDIRRGVVDEGTCVQTLHVGSFDDEGEVLRRMHEQFLPANGLRLTGRHHEIYLSDARKTPPERRRTILRQPVR
ncbi:GyrI-like domain-containing protein [Microbacterium sp. P04]|uniref:GyrI-like domain-containing protein n=1 Tax=Microbacterium sp. P04 TaxID=3366947 RepID=UPI003746D84C